MERPVLFRDFPPMDELLDTYFPDDDCSFNSAQDHHFEELVSEDGDTESFEWRRPLSIDHDTSSIDRGTKRLVSVNICSVKGNSADIFGSKVSPGIFVVKEK